MGKKSAAHSASQRKPKNKLRHDRPRQPQRQREELSPSDFINVQLRMKLESEQQG